MSAAFVVNDPLPVVRARLVDRLGAALTGGDAASRAAEVRVYAEALPSPPIVSATYPRLLPATLVVASAYGPLSQPLGTMGFPRVELRAYHTSRSAARALWFQAVAALADGPMFDDAAGVWCEVANAPALPVVDTELSSDFVLARGMIGLHALYH